MSLFYGKWGFVGRSRINDVARERERSSEEGIAEPQSRFAFVNRNLNGQRRSPARKYIAPFTKTAITTIRDDPRVLSVPSVARRKMEEGHRNSLTRKAEYG